LLLEGLGGRFEQRLGALNAAREESWALGSTK
jgi:hypothetical protein